MHAAAQGPQLNLIILAAINRDDSQVGHPLGIFLERLGDLNRQFTRRSEDQNLDLRTLLRQVHAVQQRQRESSCLASARLGLSENIAAGEQERHRLGLNRRRCFVTRSFDRSQQGRAETEPTESFFLWRRRFGLVC